MLKKLFLAIALVATASFATWDYFPVLPAGQGSVKGGLYYDWDGDWSQAGLDLGVRFSVIENLEIALLGWGYQFWSEDDCKGCPNGGDGLRDLTLAGRYQITPTVNGFLDFHLPVGNDDFGKNGHAPSTDEIALYFGAQFSMALPDAPGFKFGSEAGLDWGFEHNGFERGLEIHLGAEADYTIPNTMVTPFLGLQFKLKLFEDEYEAADGKEYGQDNSGNNQIQIWLGAAFAIDPNISIKGQLIVRSGDQDMGGDATGLYVGCEFVF
ncbi:MAG: transporter [Fibrobacter sp.]|nr:transporter [Fibrobacter sp.]